MYIKRDVLWEIRLKYNIWLVRACYPFKFMHKKKSINIYKLQKEKGLIHTHNTRPLTKPHSHKMQLLIVLL